MLARLYRPMFLIILCVTFMFAGPPHPARAGVEVGGLILTDTTWTFSDSPYRIAQDITISSEATLTIEPGVEVRFDGGKNLFIVGMLVARGTPEQPIVFTSSNETPAAGDWGSISFSVDASPTNLDANGGYQSGSILQNCVVEYAGANADSTITAYSQSVDSCTIRHNSARAISMQGSSDTLGRVSGNTLLDNLSFTDGGAGVFASYALISGNTIRDNSAPYSDGGGILAEYSTVRDNQVIHNGALYGGGIRLSNGVLDSNIIFQNSAQTGGGVYAQDSEVSNNRIVHNAGMYSGGMLAINSQSHGNSLINNLASISGGAATVVLGSFENNTAMNNQVVDDTTGSGLFLRGYPDVTGNTLYNNLPYEISASAGENITATHNFWGQATTIQIPDLIYDQVDDANLGLVSFSPVNANPSPDAPLAPPVNLALGVQGSQLTLTWETLPFAPADLRFRVYYDQDGTKPPYSDIVLSTEAAPIETLGQKFLVLRWDQP